ncbi:quinoprotein glucose dehydrogenase [Knoellia sinensis KCTC 19936]|uniref:Quinoprotein glucose dehydrogenase n=1 Tax=Knoellia sinensis KCTC 19936 TaxID=1385520 RepID=A0A0A0JA80_9MICO|nr:glucose/sorbosone family PQQ-dependent dehydrogenase [Knoellia sinensis]KGN32942.1 quinoprotein glucose dehydrogenase [Knoellia sinensis KCTC 19936]
MKSTARTRRLALILPAVAAATATVAAQAPSAASTGAEQGKAAINVSANTLARGNVAPAGEDDFEKSVLTTGLADPFEILFAPDGNLWATERTAGRVTVVDPDTGDKRTVLTIPEVVHTPGEQDGLLGMAIDSGGKGKGRAQGSWDVYLSYTYDGDPGAALDRRQRIARYTYDASSQQLTSPRTLIEGLLASDDHNSGRLKIGRDNTIYYSIGDRGNNQDLNACRLIESQRLPTAAEVRNQDWTAYQGKTLRLNRDGSIPGSNPRLDGVRSHVWTFGHRNHQGLVFDDDGRLYSAEMGPKSDDELNLLTAGGNYGWPRIAGYQDDSAYVYGNGSARASGCDPADYDAFVIPDDVPQQAESSFHDPRLVPPVRTFYTVPPDFDFQGERCAPSGLFFICYPTIAPASVDFYGERAIPGWDESLLLPTLKRGTLFRMPVASPTLVDGPLPLFRSQNRYRDTAISPDGGTIHVATDSGGLVEGLDGLPTSELANPGAILSFRHTG